VRPLDAPSAGVQARTREVERRHYLCPVCKLRDEAAPVQTIADVGYWAGPNQSRSFALSESLAFPDGTATLRKLLDFAAKHVVAAGCIALLVAWTALIVIVGFLVATRGGGAVLLLIGAIGGGIFLYQRHQKQLAQRERARALWRELWYCNRDGMVYRPATGDYFPPSQMPFRLFWQARQMQASPLTPQPQPQP
jgi:hypothetical protein